LILLIAVLAVFVTLVLALLLVPLRLTLSARGRGDPSGAWALAGAAQLGPLIGTAVAARGVPGLVELRLLGRIMYRRELGEAVFGRAEGPQPRPALKSAETAYGKVDSFASFVMRERRFLRFEILEVDVDYSFVDVALTGQLMAALYAVGGALPSKIVLRQHVSWESTDRMSLAVSSRIKLWLGLLLVDSALFVIRSNRVRKPTPRAVSGAMP
jgi:hypothetical protein